MDHKINLNYQNIILIIIQIGVIICSKCFLSYGIDTDTSKYSTLTDIAMMIFVGFGFLMTFPKHNNYSAIGYNFFISGFAIELALLWSPLCHQFLSNTSIQKVNINVNSLIGGLFCAAAVLISYGAVLGRVTLFQLGIMTFFEVFFYSLNEAIGVVKYQAVDMGGSMFIHAFGAYFGLAVSWMLNSKTNKSKSMDGNKATKYTDMFAIIGTIFLWVYWQSFNSALAPPITRHAVVANTVLALIGSCVGAFLTSSILTGKFDMVFIQNATLAGGVAIGGSSDMIVFPHNAYVIGFVAGIVSTFGYHYLTPYLTRKIGLYDGCGVHNLHGIPGIIGGIAGAISAKIVTNTITHIDAEQIFPALAKGRTESEQAWYQFATLATTLGIAITSGLMTGLLVRQIPSPKDYFNDHNEWIVPSKQKPEFDSSNNVTV
jgi:ammonium transporter Rh